jgi:transposase
MFVKSNKNERNGKVWYTHHIVHSYRDENGDPRHEYIANLTGLPEDVIERIRPAVKGETPPCDFDEISVRQGDCLRGAGQMAIWRAWRKTGMQKALAGLSEARRRSVFAMTCARITDPCSKLALKQECADTFWARRFPANRLDEDELYEVLDQVAENFYPIQERLADGREEAPVLLLYDTTSTYFEGQQAEGGEYGLSKDRRWDRYQIIVALVCDGEGCPLAVEVWPGNTQDATTVQAQIQMLRERFGIQRGIFVADGGMYSEANLDYVTEQGLDYIVGLEWHKKRELLEGLSSGQQDLFAEEGVYEWEEGGVRYVGCYSERQQHRDSTRRAEAMQVAEEELSHLRRTAAKGRYYSRAKLVEKVMGLLDSKGLRALWNVTVEPLEGQREAAQQGEKVLLDLQFSRNDVEIKRREALEGRYVVATTVEEERMDPEQVLGSYKGLQRVERGFRHMKSFLRIRPIYHRLRRRIRAHVLICFLAYYLTWWMGQELRREGIPTEVETLIRRWDQLLLSETTVEAGEHSRRQWQWSLGERGQQIKQQIQEAGIWKSIDTYKRSACNSLE